MEKLVIWGRSKVIIQTIETVRRFETAKDVKIIGICFADLFISDPLWKDRYPVIARNAPEWKDADCTLVCTEQYSEEEIREAITAGAKRDNLIPCRLIGMKGFSFSRYMNLSRSRVSIFSNCCWGGLTYHYFYLDFLSPTINLFITDKDYIHFLENLDRMLETEPEYQCTRYNPDDDLYYPVFNLSGVSLHMSHCNDPEKGLGDWKKRCLRVNRDNLLITMITGSVAAAEQFDALPFRKKICFVPFQTDLPSCVCIDPGEVPLVSFVNSFATGVRTLYDPWILLEEGRIVYTSGEDELAAACEKTEWDDLLFKTEGLLIYGAWALGNKAFHWISGMPGEKLFGFAVTSLQGNPDEKYGYPVHTIEEWRRILLERNIRQDQVCVVLALNPEYYAEVRSALSDSGFRRIIMLEELEWYISQISG